MNLLQPTRQLVLQDIVDARTFAEVTHAGDKYGEHDYMFHLDEVFDLAVELGLPLEYLIAALLHDVMEDHGITQDAIETKFNNGVANLVWAVSGFGKNRRERKVDILTKLAIFHWAIILKMIDRYANLRHALRTKNWSLVSMYLKEMPDYEQLFSTESRMWPRMQVLIAEATEALKNK